MNFTEFGLELVKSGETSAANWSLSSAFVYIAKSVDPDQTAPYGAV